LIDFYHVTKRFSGEGITALNNLTFSMDKGDFYYLLGPSGAGKTTLLRLLYRDISPDKGQILINDENIGSMPEKKIPYLRRRIGVVFQDFKLLNDRSVFDNVALSLVVRNENQHDIDRRVMRTLEQVELADKRDQKPRQLAGGEQQRVSMARALVKEPEILLADEPTGNLDPSLSGNIIDLFEEINDRGTTIIVATHDLRTIEGHEHPCIVLEDGELIEGPTKNPRDVRFSKESAGEPSVQ
jgi:cell division transport system ATP-binding protein